MEEPEFYAGFTVYKNRGFDYGLVFITPHSGPSLETPTNQDANADTVASLCWLDMGGSLVLSNVTRKRLLGIDFNRAAPSLDKALKYKEWFEKDIERNKTLGYRKKYAWVSRDKKDHKNRKRVYDDFWSKILQLGKFYIFVHAKTPRLKNYPSIMDVISFKGEGIDSEVIKSVLDKINEKYSDFFKKIKENYKQAILLEESRIADRIIKKFGKFSLERSEVEYGKHLEKDIKFIRENIPKRSFKVLEKEFTRDNFISRVEMAFRRNNENPKITLDYVYTGELAHGPKTQLKIGKDNVVIEIEVNTFLGFSYPDEAAAMISDIIREIKKVKKYKMLGYNQTQIKKFIKKDSN